MISSRPLLELPSLLSRAPTRAQSPRAISLDSATIADLNAAFDAGTLTSEQLVSMSLERIQRTRQGPMLRALITVNPKAVDVARRMDTRKAKAQDADPRYTESRWC